MLEASVATGEPVDELHAGEQEEYLNLLGGGYYAASAAAAESVSATTGGRG